MSKTYHHNAPKKSRFMQREDRYSGWEGEQNWRQEGRRHIKREEHRANRRHGEKQVLQELYA